MTHTGAWQFDCPFGWKTSASQNMKVEMETIRWRAS